MLSLHAKDEFYDRQVCEDSLEFVIRFSPCKKGF